MELLGSNSLEELRRLESKKQKEKAYGLPLASVISIATKLVSVIEHNLAQVLSLKGMHEAGYLHSDVKPNNVVFEQALEMEDLYSIDQKGTFSVNQKVQVYLLDFGLSETYVNQNGEHIEPDKINRQLGNKFFMSLSQL